MADLFNVKSLENLAKQYGFRPSREYGQNYLLNPGVIECMVEVSAVGETDVVVEVGPGFGVLTLALASRVKQVRSFEIEQRLLPYWNKLQKTYKNIEVIWGNILKSENEIDKTKPFTLVANLPYQITSQVLRLFLEDFLNCETMVVMVQKEVAERLCASKGNLSVLGIATQFYSKVEYMLDVPKHNFWPSPKVDSAVVKLQRKTQLPDVDTEKFFHLVRAGFASRRKLLVKNLMNGHYGEREKILKTFEELRLLPTARAQELDVEDWVKLFFTLST